MFGGAEKVERRGRIRAELWKRTTVPFSPPRDNRRQHGGVLSLDLFCVRACVCARAPYHVVHAIFHGLVKYVMSIFSCH